MSKFGVYNGAPESKESDTPDALRLRHTKIYWGGPLIPKFIPKYGQT